MSDSGFEKLSVSLAVDQLKKACRDWRTLTQDVKFARAERDRMIKEASYFINTSQLMRITGLSRDTIHKAKNARED